MKKIMGLIMALSISVVLLLAGCENPTTGDVTGETDNGEGDSSALFLGGYDVDTDFKVHVWDNTHALADTDEGVRITANGSAVWSGGSLAARVADDGFSEGFDFSNVATLVFKVRGSLPAGQLEVFLQSGSDDVVRAAVTAHGISSLSETDWQDVSIDVSSAQAANITSAFSHVFEAPVTAGQWVEFSSIDWLDADGNSVSILF